MREFVKSCSCFFLFCLFCGMITFLWHLNDRAKPTVYKSASTGEVVRVELQSEEIPRDEIGDRYHLIWVR
jgi:hypothetical protein